MVFCCCSSFFFVTYHYYNPDGSVLTFVNNGFPLPYTRTYVYVFFDTRDLALFLADVKTKRKFNSYTGLYYDPIVFPYFNYEMEINFSFPIDSRLKSTDFFRFPNFFSNSFLGTYLHTVSFNNNDPIYFQTPYHFMCFQSHHSPAFFSSLRNALSRKSFSFSKAFFDYRESYSLYFYLNSDGSVIASFPISY